MQIQFAMATDETFYRFQFIKAKYMHKLFLRKITLEACSLMSA